MKKVADQNIFNAVLTGAGFVTVNQPCYFTFKAGLEPLDEGNEDIHYTKDSQIWGKDALTLYIANPFPTSDPLAYAKEP